MKSYVQNWNCLGVSLSLSSEPLKYRSFSVYNNDEKKDQTIKITVSWKWEDRQIAKYDGGLKQKEPVFQRFNLSFLVSSSSGKRKV